MLVFACFMLRVVEMMINDDDDDEEEGTLFSW